MLFFTSLPSPITKSSIVFLLSLPCSFWYLLLRNPTESFIGELSLKVMIGCVEENMRNGSGSSSSSLNSIFLDTEDDHKIASILAEDENLKSDNKLGKRLSHLNSIPHTPRVNGEIPDVNDATEDHQRLSERLVTYGLAELHMEGDGNCQFRALADQLFGNSDYHKHVRRQVIKQLKHHKKLYEGYVPMEYKSYLKKMKKSGEWGDHVTLQAAADRFEAKVCLVTSFRDTCYVEILPTDKSPTRELWLSFWSEVHYNSLYTTGDVPSRVPRKKFWLSRLMTDYGMK
ncbi:hypothetical protein VNO78_22382 [Psophocarpus tetragonolobus]|uniref:ubiquitinyl hydrolase 1 n=1 Tax=Psophocarpus tetragonolobus TaxID=3891 RepID=A0AAN9XJ47_PSOTE